MRKLGITTAVLAIAAATGLAASSALAGPAAAQKRLLFKGSYAGTATTKLTDNVVDIAAKGTGTGTLLGKGVLLGTGKGDATGRPSCVPFTGPGTISGKVKTTVKVKVKGKVKVKVKLVPVKLKFMVQPTSTGCAGEDQNQITASGKIKVLGGTGAFKKAGALVQFKKMRGVLDFTGYYDRSSGAFNVKFTGTLLY